MGILKVLVGPSDEYLTVFNLRAMDLPGFEFHLTFQINISCKQNPLVDIVVQRIYRNPQFRMTGKDHVR